jgi:integrase
LGAVIERYIEKKTGTTWKSKSAAQSTSGVLRAFLASVITIHGVDPDIEEIDDVLVIAAVKARWENHGSTGTYSVNWGRVKTFLNWAGKRGYKLQDLDGFLDEKNPVKPNVPKQFITREENGKAIANELEKGNFRDAYLFDFLFEAHRRISEVLSMQVKHVDLRPQGGKPYGFYLYHRHKTAEGALETITLQEREAEILKAWLEMYEQMLGRKPHGDDYLFPARYAIGKSIPGERREYQLVPERRIAKHVHLFRKAYEAVGVWQRWKNSHANRRGGMEEAFLEFEERKIPDAIGKVMARSGHSTRDVAFGYLNRDANKMRSDEAYFQIRRGIPQEPAEEISEENSDTIPLVGNTSSNVVDFSSRLRARA